jgi:hypothetical protein
MFNDSVRIKVGDVTRVLFWEDPRNTGLTLDLIAPVRGPCHHGLTKHPAAAVRARRAAQYVLGQGHRWGTVDRRRHPVLLVMARGTRCPHRARVG